MRQRKIIEENKHSRRQKQEDQEDILHLQQNWWLNDATIDRNRVKSEYRVLNAGNPSVNERLVFSYWFDPAQWWDQWTLLVIYVSRMLAFWLFGIFQLRKFIVSRRWDSRAGKTQFVIGQFASSSSSPV